MEMDGTPRFRLSIWRPAQPTRPLDYARLEDKTKKDLEGFDRTRLYEEIYYWHPWQEDVWGSIQDPQLSSSMRDLFVDGFAPHLPPEKRAMQAFADAVSKFREALSNSSASWADSTQTVRLGRDEPVNLRANSPLALISHIEWLVRTFASVPGATVVIR